MNDVIVIGGGPAGSTAATLLARKGFSVLLLERDRFPRFQIGESLLPYNNDLFARLGVTDKLKSGDFFPKYGAQFVTGDGKIEYTFRFDRTLPPEYSSSFQVKRAEFDELLLRNASSTGVDVREQTGVTSVDLSDPSRAVVQTNTGERHEARFVLDASGHGALLGNRIGEKSDVESLKKVALFAHYRGVPLAEGRDAGNTVIVVLQNAWLWMIPVNKELMSVGLVVDRDHVRDCGLTPEELLNRTIAAAPWVAARMRDAERVTQVYARRDFSYRMKRIVGENYALIGDAAGFLDPIFSTGVFMAMKSADIASNAVEARLRKGSMRLLKRYQRDMSSALEKYFKFISNFYRREFLEVFLQPGEHFGLLPVIVGVLAGNVFAKKWDRLRLGLFFVLVAIQKRKQVIAPPIVWDALPAAATSV
jgi:flavin-dependent dehydrogenase